MSKCPICKNNLNGFNWVKTKNGKNWLQNNEGQWHDCPKSTGKYESKQKWINITSDDLEFCELCGRFYYKIETFEKYPQLEKQTLEEHVKLWHPNGELLDDIDFMVLDNKQKDKIRYKWIQPKRKKKYVLIGKILY